MDHLLIPAVVQLGPAALWALVVFLFGWAAAGRQQVSRIDKKLSKITQQNTDVKNALQKQRIESKLSARKSLIWAIAIALLSIIATVLVTWLVVPNYVA